MKCNIYICVLLYYSNLLYCTFRSEYAFFRGFGFEEFKGLLWESLYDFSNMVPINVKQRNHPIHSDSLIEIFQQVDHVSNEMISVPK